MAINNIADLFVATLEQAGVKRIYGMSATASTVSPRRCAAAAPSNGCTSATRRSRPSRPPAKPR